MPRKAAAAPRTAPRLGSVFWNAGVKACMSAAACTAKARLRVYRPDEERICILGDAAAAAVMHKATNSQGLQLAVQVGLTWE